MYKKHTYKKFRGSDFEIAERVRLILLCGLLRNKNLPRGWPGNTSFLYTCLGVCVSVSVDPHVDIRRNSGILGIRENVKSFSFKREPILY